MNSTKRSGPVVTLVLSLVVALVMAVPTLAQQGQAQQGQVQQSGQGRGEGGGQGQTLPPREVQQLFDGYAVIQGQQFLGLNDAQFAQFLPKFRALQETRRRNEIERLRLLQELNRMTNGRAAQAGDNELRERLRMLKDVEARSIGDIQRARDAVDQTLDIRQQARFRIFEEQIEQRKLQLLMQVRQNRANANRPPRN